MKKILFYFAVTAWILALVVHILSIADINLADPFPFVWMLHIGIFVVWVPTIFSLSKNEELIAFQKSNSSRRANPLKFIKIVFKQAPAWLKVIAVVGLFYPIINFLLMDGLLGSPDIKDGQYILHNHGHLIKVLTLQEYDHYKANELRGFSAIWLVFYGFAATALFPFKQPETAE
jgi:hypothetical protein